MVLSGAVEKLKAEREGVEKKLEGEDYWRVGTRGWEDFSVFGNLLDSVSMSVHEFEKVT